MIVPELLCTDLAATKQFYCDVLGFTIKYERPEERFVYFTFHGADLMVEELSAERRQWVTAALVPPFGRGINLQWSVSGIGTLYERVKQLAADAVYLPFEEKAYRCGEEIALQRQFIVQNPDGYLFRFCCDESIS